MVLYSTGLEQAGKQTVYDAAMVDKEGGRRKRERPDLTPFSLSLTHLLLLFFPPLLLGHCLMHLNRRDNNMVRNLIINICMNA